jgi:ribosomal protein S3
LSLFTNQRFNLALTLKQLNETIRHNLTANESQLLTKNLVKLRRYQENEFFKEGINILFLTTTNKHSAHLLANFIAEVLGKLKRHNLFLRFLKAVLSLFYNKSFSIVKGLKIKISGRFNGAPRARSRILKIGNIPVLKISSKLDYHEATSFTSNGTFGIKVFICQGD